MIIYNVTSKVEHSIADSWLIWLRKEYIPEMTGTGCFTHAVILHLAEADDDDGVTYAVQYHATDAAHYTTYVSKYSETMRKKAIAKWGDRLISFHTMMRVVN